MKIMSNMDHDATTHLYALQIASVETFLCLVEKAMQMV